MSSPFVVVGTVCECPGHGLRLRVPQYQGNTCTESEQRPHPFYGCHLHRPRFDCGSWQVEGCLLNLPSTTGLHELATEHYKCPPLKEAHDQQKGWLAAIFSGPPEVVFKDCESYRLWNRVPSPANRNFLRVGQQGGESSHYKCQLWPSPWSSPLDLGRGEMGGGCGAHHDRKGQKFTCRRSVLRPMLGVFINDPPHFPISLIEALSQAP